AEVFLRDPKGVIRAGIRYVRLDDDQEFNSFEMEKLNTMHKLFASMWCNALARHQEELILSDLTYREREMLQLLFLGYPNQDIARLLSIALPTVKSHMKNILTKTGYSNRAELIGALYQTGLPLRC
ncbi:LuxR C-terminal-related transcriptional regulator, partial [Paenochrobactrum sp. BZR 201-1]